MAVRYAEKFTSQDGGTGVVFPLAAYEWQSQAPLRVAALRGVGADYAYDPLQNGVAASDVASESVRFIARGANAAAVDAIVDDIRSKLLTIGRGKLWTVDAAGNRRWAYARLAAMPDVQVAVPALVHVPVVLQFTRYSSWFSESRMNTDTSVSGSPLTFVVNNPGNIAAKFVTIRFRSKSASGFTHPSLTNDTNGYSIGTTRDAVSANSEVKVDTERMSVEFSDDDGASYSDDYANFTFGSLQGSFFELAPGDNSLTYTDGGTPDLSLEISFYPPFA